MDVSKIIGPLFMPMGLLWLIVLGAMVFAAWRRRWLRAVLLLFGAAVLSVIGSTTLPFQLLAGLERPYTGAPGLGGTRPDAIVLLGGTLTGSTHDPLKFNASDGFDRVLAALELARLRRASILVLCGGGGQGWRESELIEGWVRKWGLSAPNLMALPASQNTREEALKVKELWAKEEWKKVLLVTSAYHMGRSKAVFESLGMQVEPVACDFMGLAALENGVRLTVAPKIDGFQALDLYLHEIVGRQYYRWKGWIGKEEARTAPGVE